MTVNLDLWFFMIVKFDKVKILVKDGSVISV